MARVNQRPWKIPGQRTKRKAWGYTVQIVEDGKKKQKRVYKAEWTKDDAEQALAAALLKIEEPKPKTPGLTLTQAAERYLAAKARKRSRSEDERILKHLKSSFGAETQLVELTAGRISEYKTQRLGTVRKIGEGATATERRLTAAAVNRPLALLRHLLRLACEEWEVLPSVPRIRLEREPEGRLRWLTPEEARRLLDACGESKNADLADLVELAMFTGLRRGEALGLTWERVDRARGVLLLDTTKTDRRREVPLNAPADGVLARRHQPDATGLVFGSRNWNRYRTAWETAVGRAKLCADFRFHDLRHTYASWLTQRGRTLKEIQEALGHRTVTMTNRYSHLAPDHLRAAVAVLDGVLSATKSSEPASSSTQDSTQEPLELVGMSQKS